MKEKSISPVSFVVSVARLPQKGMPLTLDATADQRARLAEDHGLLEVARFHADILVTGWKRNGIRVAGKVEAEITQECVVTLEPLPARIAEEFSQVYLPEDSKLGRLGFESGGEILLDAEGPDSPETFAGDTIDVGALAEEFFGLALDPYPRKSDAQLPSVEDSSENPLAGQLRAKLVSFTRKA